MLCGILFKTSYYNKTDKVRFQEALELLHHRGPDETGILYTNVFSFGHKRLAIRDIVNGKQPMSILNHHLIYNGELYNTEYLNKLLNITSDGDTFTLLSTLMKYDKKALDLLNGIFAFVYFNGDKILAARDHFGVKPLYYSLKNNDLIIASEMKAILHYQTEAIVTYDGLREVIGMGPSHSIGKTPYKDIYELPPGCCLTFDKENGLIIDKYFDLQALPCSLSQEESILKVKELVTNAINNQLVSDVGISAFLSGGLDSSIITLLAAKKETNLDTYSIDYDGNKNKYQVNEFETSNDQDFVKYIVDKGKTNQHNVVIGVTELVNGIDEALFMKDYPGMTTIDSSMIYLASKIKEKHKVALSGECADEVFGGYPWFYKQGEYDGFPWIRNLDYRNSILKKEIRDKLDLKAYVDKAYQDIVNEVPLNEADSKEMKKERIMSYINIKYFMTTLLERKDRMTMSKSLEVRVPFADKDLVSFLYNVPFKDKMFLGKEKALLREAFKDELPIEIYERKKSPYPRSQNELFFSIIKNKLICCLDNKDSILHQLLDIDKLKEEIESPNDLNTPWFGQLMRKCELFAYLYQIDLWFRKYKLKLEGEI